MVSKRKENSSRFMRAGIGAVKSALTLGEALESSLVVYLVLPSPDEMLLRVMTGYAPVFV